MKRRVLIGFFTYFIFLLMLFCFNIPLTYAQETETIQRVYSDDISTSQGKNVQVSILADNFNSVGSFEMSIVYDYDNFSILNVNKSSLLENDFISTNLNDRGIINVSVVSSSNEGINGSGTLFILVFNVNMDAAIGKSIISIAIGEAYNLLLEPIEIFSNSFAININENNEVNKSTIFSSSQPKKIKKGECESVYYYSSMTNNFSSAVFEINYDPTKLSVNSFNIGKAISDLNGIIYSINDSIDGYINFTFTALEGVHDYTSQYDPLFYIEFVSIVNISCVSEIEFKSSSIYDINLNPISSNSNITKLELCYTEIDIELPIIYVEQYVGFDSTFSIDIIAEKESLIAAGDFIVYYDKEILSCLAAEKTLENSLIVANIKKDQFNSEIGQIKFSFIFSGGISNDVSIIKLTFKPLDAKNTSLILTSSGIYDEDYQLVDVNCVDGDISISHNKKTINGKEPTCTDIGWDSYEYCENCDYTTYVEKQAKGHDIIFHKGKSPTCVDNGWLDYYTCNRCDYSTYEIVNNLGHSYNSFYTVDLIPTCTDEGIESRHCIRCNDRIDERIIPLNNNNHDYSEVNYQWTDDNQCVATRVCENNNKHIEYANAVVSFESFLPDCEEDGKIVYTATFNELWAVTQIKEIPLYSEGHKFNDYWTYNDTFHYHECKCGEMTDLSEHEFDKFIVVKEASFDENGIIEYSCICGYKYYEKTPKLEKEENYIMFVLFGSFFITVFVSSIFIYLKIRKRKI